jgi:hypothetical protein
MPTMTMTGPAEVDSRARLNHLAWLLDNSIRLPGTNFRVGLEALLGFVPVIGDAAGVVLSGYIVHEAARLGVPAGILFRMVLNVAIEGVLGSVPFAGDIFDAAWKANQRNVDLLNAYLDRPEKAAAATRVYLFFLLVMMAVVVLATSVVAYWLVNWVWNAFATPIA